MHFHNTVLHYLYTMTVAIVIYAKARVFKAKANKYGFKTTTKDKE